MLERPGELRLSWNPKFPLQTPVWSGNWMTNSRKFLLFNEKKGFLLKFKNP